MNILNWIKKFFTTKDIIDNTSKNVDLGSSSVKYYIDGKLGSFISSVRRLENTVEIVDQQNIIKVNGVWYSVGESKTPVSAESRKCKKEHIDIMVLYSLVREKTKPGQYNINTLLPYNQLGDKTELRNKIKGQYKVETTLGDKYSYTLDAPQIKCEGQMSYHYIKDSSSICTVIINIGFFSTDIAIYKGQEQEEPVTIQTATNLIMNQYKHKLDAPNTSVLSYRLMNGDKFTRKEEEENRISIQSVFKGLINDIKVVLRFVPDSSKIIICGGGAIQYGDMLRDSLEHKNVVVLRGDDAVYTDVLGLAKHCKGKVQLESEQSILDTPVHEKTQSVQGEINSREQTVQTVNPVQNVYTCIIDRHKQNGENITDLCKEYKVSRTSFYDYRRKLVKGNV